LNTATLFICIDAFSKTYLSKENTPFLFDLASRGLHSSIKPLFAFRGIETTMFSGVWPEEHGTWTEIRLKGKKQLPQLNTRKLLVQLLDIVNLDKARKIGRVAIQCLLDRTTIRLTPNLIPAEAFGYFEPSQKKAIFEEGSIGSIPTLFDMLRSHGFNFAFIEPSFINGDRGVIDKVAALSNSDRNIKFWYLKFGSPDKAGHIYGPSPDKFKITLRKIDGYLQQVIEILQRRYDNLAIMIMADHGMSRVDSYYDILSNLGRLNSTMYKDYVLFLDSTMARFWFFTDISRLEIENYLKKQSYGHLLSAEEAKHLHIPSDTRYGESIFVMEEGKMIYPDFWSGTRKAKGMHGYAFHISEEALPIFVLNNEMYQYCKKENDFTYIDVFELLQSSLSFA
jgi:predicted AlkP superfamily pyrophosphatase or phosphodiesterase